MIRPGSTRTAFPTETRKVPGTDDYKSHILAFCRDCGAEGAILIPNSAGSVPPEAGTKMFRRRLGWKMGAHRNKDVCPSCAATSKVRAAPQDRREEVRCDLRDKLLTRVALDPAYTEQKEYDVLYQDYPLLALLMAKIEVEYETEGRAMPRDMKARGEVLLQAALKRARRDQVIDDQTLAEIDDRIEQIHHLMAELTDEAATLIPIMEQVNAFDMPKNKPVPEVAEMTHAPTDTALGAAFLKAQTDRIKEEGARRPPRSPEDQAALDRLVADQARDDRSRVRLVGAQRKAPLPTAPKPVAAPPVLRVVPPVPEPAPRKAPNRAKRTGGWDDMTPEQHADRVARMSLKRNLSFAQKAGLSLEEWTQRNERRKAEAEERREKKQAQKASPIPTTPKPETPMKAQPAPLLIHDNTVTPTAAGVLDRLKISEALTEHYVRATSNGEGGYYLGDGSDAGLASTLGVPVAWVAERREAMLFGPDVNEHFSQDSEEIEALLKEIDALKATQDRLFDQGAAEVSQIEARQTALIERIKVDTKTMLDDASEKVATAVAQIEDRVAGVEQRVRALAERR